MLSLRLKVIVSTLVIMNNKHIVYNAANSMDNLVTINKSSKQRYFLI